MLKRFITSILALTVFTMSFSYIAFAQAVDDKEAQRERDAQIFVNKVGISEKIKVEVKLKDGRKSVKGYISEINDDSFAVTDKKKNTTTTFKYSEVKKVSKVRTEAWVALGVVVGAIIVAGIICASRCED